MQLESLELRRLRLDIYIQTGTCIWFHTSQPRRLFQTIRRDHRDRSHKYRFFPPSCSCNAKYNFCTYRTAIIWNTLPADNTDFTDLNNFRRSLTSTFLASSCEIYHFSNCYIALSESVDFSYFDFTAILSWHVNCIRHLSL